MAESAKPLVLIVDEIPSIIRLLELELSTQGFVTAGCGIGEEAFRAVDDLHPRVVLLEIVLPGMSGLDMLQQLKKRYPELPVIILTTISVEADRATAFDLGADDFIHKPFDPQELGQRVTAIVGGGATARRVLRHQDLTIDLTRRMARRGQQVIALTTNEWATLLALALHPREWLSTSELLRLVAGDDSPSSQRLLLPVIEKLRETLETNPESPRLLLGDATSGYMLAMDPDPAPKP